MSDFVAARAEYRALISNCGVHQTNSRGKIELTGDDRVRWLNGMVTNNVRDLAVGHGVYAFLLSPQGRILGDMYAYNFGESLIVDTDQGQITKIWDTFDHHIIMDDVNMKDVSKTTICIGIAGPKAASALQTAGFAVDELQPLQFKAIRWRDHDVTVVRGDNPSIASYELWVLPDNAELVKAELIKAGAISVDATALEWLRIASGIPRYGSDIREKDLPQETEQERALNFNKGCYVGQEIVERIRSRGAVHRQFTGFVIDGPMLEAGAELRLEEKKVAEITSAASVPLGDGTKNIALGYVRREVAVLKKPLDGNGFIASVASLPFEEFLKI